MVGYGQEPGILCQKFQVWLQLDLLLFHFYYKICNKFKVSAWNIWLSSQCDVQVITLDVLWDGRNQ